jgi:hypothetical protein
LALRDEPLVASLAHQPSWLPRLDDARVGLAWALGSTRTNMTR